MSDFPIFSFVSPFILAYYGDNEIYYSDLNKTDNLERLDIINLTPDLAPINSFATYDEKAIIFITPIIYAYDTFPSFLTIIFNTKSN